MVFVCLFGKIIPEISSYKFFNLQIRKEKSKKKFGSIIFICVLTVFIAENGRESNKIWHSEKD